MSRGGHPSKYAGSLQVDPASSDTIVNSTILVHKSHAGLGLTLTLFRPLALLFAAKLSTPRWLQEMEKKYRSEIAQA